MKTKYARDVNLIEFCYYVVFERNDITRFYFKGGVQQGAMISPQFFTLTDITVFNEIVELELIKVFADGIVLIATIFERLQTLAEQLAEALTKI